MPSKHNTNVLARLFPFSSIGGGMIFGNFVFFGAGGGEGGSTAVTAVNALLVTVIGSADVGGPSDAIVEWSKEEERSSVSW